MGWASYVGLLKPLQDRHGFISSIIIKFPIFYIFLWSVLLDVGYRPRRLFGLVGVKTEDDTTM